MAANDSPAIHIQAPYPGPLRNNNTDVSRFNDPDADGDVDVPGKPDADDATEVGS